MTVEVRLVKAEPTPAQLRAWAALWRLLLGPDADAPVLEPPHPDGGGGGDA
jgi:hypothetical protein